MTRTDRDILESSLLGLLDVNEGLFCSWMKKRRLKRKKGRSLGIVVWIKIFIVILFSHNPKTYIQNLICRLANLCLYNYKVVSIERNYLIPLLDMVCSFNVNYM